MNTADKKGDKIILLGAARPRRRRRVEERNHPNFGKRVCARCGVGEVTDPQGQCAAFGGYASRLPHAWVSP